MTTKPGSRPAGEVVRWSLLTAAFAFFAWTSWRTWPDILVDFGSELYIPWRLSEGEVLYRDIAFTMGPLSQYFNALLFRLFGVSLNTLIVANLVILAGIVVMLQWLFRRCGTPWTATIGGLFFLAVFAFSQYAVIGNYNYVCPYRHEVTHGLALGLLELICLVKFHETRAFGWMAAAGFCLGLVFLTKTEMLLPAVLAAGTGVGLTAVGRGRVNLPSAEGGEHSRGGASAADSGASSARQSPSEAAQKVESRPLFVVRCLAALALAAAAPFVVALALLSISLGWTGAVEAAFTNIRLSLNPALTVESGFYRTLGGWNETFEHWLPRMTESAIVILAVIATGLLVDDLLRRVPKLPAPLTPVMGVAAAVATVWLVPGRIWDALPAALPLLLLLAAAVAIGRVLRGGTEVRSTFPLCLIAVYGLFLLPKILLAVNWGHYGFVLAMPGTMVLIHVLIHSFPVWRQRHGGSGRYFKAVATGFLAACAFVHFAMWSRIDAAKTERAGSARDMFYVETRQDVRSKPAVETLEKLRELMKPGQTMCVIPEGTMLNYQLRMRNPTGFLMLTPWEFEAHGGEGRVVEALERSPPDYIVYVTMDMSIHGRGNFGNPEYGGRIAHFINTRYKSIDVKTTEREVRVRRRMRTQVLFASTIFQRTDATN